MRAVFDEKNKVFLLHTQNTTYAIAVTEDKYVNRTRKCQKLSGRYLNGQPTAIPPQRSRGNCTP